MKNIEKLLKGLYDDKEIYPDVEAHLKDKMKTDYPHIV
jgi:hypothetical protein